MSEQPVGLSAEKPIQPFGEITKFSADKLQNSLKTERSVKLPQGTVAMFRVGVRGNDHSFSYHDVSKAVLDQDVIGVPVRTTNVGVELPEVATVEFKPVSETYLQVSQLLEEKQSQFDKLVEDQMKSQGLAPLDFYERRSNIEDYISERNPWLVSNISALNQTLSLEGEKAAKAVLATTKLERQLSDLNINSENIVDAGFVVSTEKMVRT